MTQVGVVQRLRRHATIGPSCRTTPCSAARPLSDRKAQMSFNVRMSGDVTSLGGQSPGEEPGPAPKGPPVHTPADAFENQIDLAHLGADPTVLFDTASPTPAPSQTAPSQGGNNANGTSGASGNGNANPDGGKSGSPKTGNDKSVMDKMKDVIGGIVDKDGVRVTDNISVGGSLNPRMVTVTIKF